MLLICQFYSNIVTGLPIWIFEEIFLLVCQIGSNIPACLRIPNLFLLKYFLQIFQKWLIF